MRDYTIEGDGVISTPDGEDAPAQTPYLNPLLIPALAIGTGLLVPGVAEIEGGELLGEEGVAAVDSNTVTADIIAENEQNLQNLLMPNGQRIGQAGNSSDVRILQGDADDAQAFFNQLTQGGKVITKSDYEGTFIELPNGTTLGIRTTSTNSPYTASTIDLGNLPKTINIRKIKFNP